MQAFQMKVPRDGQLGSWTVLKHENTFLPIIKSTNQAFSFRWSNTMWQLEPFKQNQLTLFQRIAYLLSVSRCRLWWRPYTVKISTAAVLDCIQHHHKFFVFYFISDTGPYFMWNIGHKTKQKNKQYKQQPASNVTVLKLVWNYAVWHYFIQTRGLGPPSKEFPNTFFPPMTLVFLCRAIEVWQGKNNSQSQRVKNLQGTPTPIWALTSDNWILAIVI